MYIEVYLVNQILLELLANFKKKGNLCRELFDDPDYFADTLRLPRDLVRGIAIIWKTLTW